MNGETANKFVSALVKALQTLCHGYVEFNDGIEIIGHIYLNIDNGASFDYVVKEKLCKNAENSTVFVSKSFQAQAPIDESVTRKARDEDETAAFEDSSNMSPTAGTSRLQSAITSISNVLSGSQDSQKSRHLDHTSHHSSPQNTGKRKREHGGSYSSMQPPFKYTTLQTSSSLPSSYFSSGPSSKQAADRNHSEHFNNPSHAEFFGGDSNQSSELPSSHSNILHDGTSGSSSLGYSSNHHQGSQQFAGGTAGDMRSINEDFQDSSQVDIGQHTGQEPPNPRNPAANGNVDMKTWSQQFVTAPAGTHFQGHRHLRSYNCGICGLLISHRKNIRRHMRKHTGEMFFCDICDWRGTCRWKMQKHREKKHGIQPSVTP